MNKWTKLAACTALAGSIGLPVELAFAQVDELVVTARKREESLQDVPLSVSAFSSQQLEQKNLFGIEEIAQFVPGFEMDRSFQRGFDRPVIRGKSVILTSGEPGTSFFINGAFFYGTLSSIDLDEAERVEIIKGPQSALYGRATYAGAVNVITKLPGNEWTGKISGTAAQKDEFTISGGISGPLVQDILSVGVYARHYEFGGMWRSETDGRRLGEEESDSIAGTIVFTPNEDWQITLRGVYDDRDDGAVPTNLHPFRLNNVFLRTPDFTIDSTIDQKRFPGFEYFDGELKQQAFQSNNTIASLLGEPGESEEHWGVQFNVEWDITDAFKFLSFTSFDEFDSQFILGAHEAGGGVFAGGPCSPSFFFCFVPPATPTDLSFQIAGGGISNFIVNDDVSTNSFSQDIRIEYDDGGAWRAALGGYHYNRNTTGVNLGFPGLDLAASLTPDQSAAILGSMRRYSQIIAREICTDAYSGICDPTTGSPILGGSVPAAFFNLNDPAAVVAALGNDLGSQSIDKTTNWAVYGRVEWDITSQWTVVTPCNGKNSQSSLRTSFSTACGSPPTTHSCSVFTIRL